MRDRRSRSTVTVLEVFQNLEATAIGEAVRQSYWLFPVIEAFHLVGLTLLGGCVIIVDLRLLGFCFTSQKISIIAKGTNPYLIGSLILMFSSGIPLALSEMLKLDYNFSFWVKVSALAIAVLFTFTLHNRISSNDEGNRVLQCTVAVISLGLWFTVAGAGRWIGFSG